MAIAKILVVGAIQGKLKKAFEKISKLHQKQDFSLCLVVGDVFSTESADEAELAEFLNGAIKVPLPTYFTVGDSVLPTEVAEKLEATDEVCTNLIYSGRKGTFTTSDGIRIVTLGGRLMQATLSTTTALGRFDPLFIEADARGLYGAHSAHILLTNQWPANVARFSDIPLPEGVGAEAVQCVANLDLALKPWYHFSSSPSACWEREPFKQPDEYGSLDDAKLTRFKSVGSVSGATKDWMTAFSLDISKPPTATKTTESPFLRGASPPRKRPVPTDGHDGYPQYGNGNRHGRRPKRQRNLDPNDCFMCLNKPEFKTHLVVSIGDESIVTVLRGPLPLPETFPELSFSGHAMIIPHYHAADEIAQGKRSKEEMAAEFEEMNKFRKALSQMVGVKSHGRLGTVCTEVNRTGIRHFHWQVIPMEAAKIRKGLVEAAFKLLAEKHGYPPFEACDPNKLPDQKSDFCRIWLWAPSDAVDSADQRANGQEIDEGITKSLYFPVSPNLDNFYLWYPREVCAGLLQLEHRTNWKSTLHHDDIQERKIEEADAEGLKTDFAEHDFAMQ